MSNKPFAARLFPLLLAGVLLLACGCSFSTDDPFSAPSDTSDPPVSGSSQTPSQPASSSPSVIPLPQDSVVSVLACGDNLIHPSVYFYAMECAAKSKGENCTYAATNEADYDFLSIYENVADRMRAADICYINQETLFGGEGTEIDGYPRFNSPEAMGATLKELGVDIVNMAHNHMLDIGSDKAIINTDAFCRSAGMLPLGYYKNQADTDNIPLLESKGIKFAFLTYTSNTNGLTCYSDTYIPYFEENLIRKQVALAKQQADVVIVSAHWGDEYAFQPNSMQKRYASLFCELGVDVVIGMHPHCLEPMEWMEGTDGHKMLLAYSIGNFLSGMHEGQTTLEGMLSFDVRKDSESGNITIENPILTPIVAHYTYVRSVDSQRDSGYRNFKLYDLKDYTEELASQHGSKINYEGRKGGSPTLYGENGGSYSLKNLYTTLHRVISNEFLPPEYQNS